MEQIANNIIDYLTDHQEDPGNTLLGSPLSPSVVASLKPLIQDDESSRQPHDSDNDNLDALETIIRRWHALRSDPELVMSDIEDFVAKMNKRVILRRGEIVAVDVKGMNDESRSRLSNDKWDQVSQMSYVYGRICKEVKNSKEDIEVCEKRLNRLRLTFPFLCLFFISCPRYIWIALNKML